MANVIINLVPGTQEGVTEAIQSVNRLTAADNAAAQAFDKNNQAFQERSQEIKASTAEMSKFVAATKSIPKVIVGGAAREVAQLTQAVKSGELAINAYATAAAAAKRQLAELPKDSAAYRTLSKEIQAAATAQDFFQKGATTLRAEYAQVRNAIGALIEAGLDNTKIFRDLTARGGELSDTIGDISERTRALGSDTRNIDAAVEFVGGLAAAYSVAQGAAALLGEENEELQRVLLKVNAAMAIANGLQQVSTLLKGQSATIQVVENVQRLAGVAATNLQSAAESRYTVVRVLATQAQTALNAAMAANPATLLLLAITALAAGLLILFNRTDDAAEAQEELARQAELTNQSLENQLEVINLLAEADSRQISLLRARGATAIQVAQAERQALQEQIRRNNEVIRQTIGLQGAEDRYTEALQNAVTLRSELRVKEAEIAQLALKNQAETNKKFLDDQVAAADIAVAQTTSAYERFEATAQAIIIRLRRTLASTELTPNQRVLAEIEAGQQIIKARQEWIGELTKIDATYLAQYEKNLARQVLATAKSEQDKLQERIKANNVQLEIIIKQQEDLEKRQFDLQLQTAQSLSNSLVEILRNRAAEEQEILQERFEQGLITEEQFELERRKMRRKAAVEEKQMAIFQASLALALGVLSIIKDQTIPVPAKPIFIALTTAAALAQIAAISSRPIPAFKKGTKNAPGGPSLIAEAGPELWYTNGKLQYVTEPSIVDMRPGDKVVPALDTQKILSSWNIPGPAMPKGYGHQDSGGFSMDYEEMGRMMAKELKKLPISVFNWDETGHHQYTERLDSINTYRKNRYSFGRR